MRRLSDRQPSATLFRGSERTRLMTMIVMLGVIAMLMVRARDPNTWRMFGINDAGETSTFTRRALEAIEDAPARKPRASSRQSLSAFNVGDASQPAAKPEAEAEVPSTTSTVIPLEERAIDLDPEEADAAREQFEAITDKEALGSADMFAYWRLFKWAHNQTADEMLKRARRNVSYSQIFNDPEKYRGKLLAFDLHLRQAISYDAPRSRVE